MSSEKDDKQTSPSVLDPIERVSEVIFGILMAMTFTGTLSVATAGEQEIRTMMLTALGCNLAWGLTDAVMYLVSTATERHRKVALLRSVKGARDHAEADRLIAAALPERLSGSASPQVLEALRKRLLALEVPSAVLHASDYRAAVGVSALVVLATFPVVVPFILLDDVGMALRVSNGLAVATLFIAGWTLGRYAGDTPWRSGLAMTAIGVALVAIIIALGG